MKKEAQEFMITHGITTCFECDGLLFQHIENAEARKASSQKKLVTHTLNAGAKNDTSSVTENTSE